MLISFPSMFSNVACKEFKYQCILGRTIAGFTHFFQRSLFFFRTKRNIPASKLNEVHVSAFLGTFTFFTIRKKFIHTTKFLHKSHTCTLLSAEANLHFERVNFLYKYD